MEVDREQFLKDGFLIVRDLIPPEELESVRDAYEIMVDRQRAIWRKERATDAPPGGAGRPEYSRGWPFTIWGIRSMGIRGLP